MRRVRAVLVSLLVAALSCATTVASSRQQPPAPQSGAPQAPATPSAQTPPGTPAPVQARTFTAPAGVLFTTVRPERVADFEKVMAYLQAAFEKSTDQRVREQAKGWRIFKGEVINGSVVYVYLLDPTVVGADYGIGKILADAFPDQVEQLWKLYTGAVTGGGSLMNMTPVKATTLPPLEPTTKGKPAEPPKP